MAAKSPDGNPIDPVENQRRMAAGELYWAFTPDLIEERRRCTAACRRFNALEDPTRRELTEHWKVYGPRITHYILPSIYKLSPLTLNPSIIGDATPLPPPAATAEEDEALLEDYPWIDLPVRIDYGRNIKQVSHKLHLSHTKFLTNFAFSYYRLGKNVYINSHSTWIDTCTITIGDRTLRYSPARLPRTQRYTRP
jgi:hypothetical protein